MNLVKNKLINLLLLTAILSIFGYILYTPNITFAQAPNPAKRVEINLTKQRLYAFQNGKIIYNFAVSSGKTKTPTITGTFYPQRKFLADEMIGGSKTRGDYYDLKNVPYVVYFYGGMAIHGTYWHHNFGFPMSHGCINMRTDQAKLIYNWIDTSTPINIYGITPRS